MARRKRRKEPGWLFGLGLDSDGHARITRGENFLLMGGTHQTHGRMQEKAVKLNELLKARGKCLEEISHDEFCDIAEKLSLKAGPRPWQANG